MTKEEKEQYLNMPTVGVSATLSVLEVKTIEYGIDDYIVFTVPRHNGKRTVRRAKINEGADRPYFFYEDFRVYMDEIIRC